MTVLTAPLAGREAPPLETIEPMDALEMLLTTLRRQHESQSGAVERAKAKLAETAKGGNAAHITSALNDVKRSERRLALTQDQLDLAELCEAAAKWDTTKPAPPQSDDRWPAYEAYRRWHARTYGTAGTDAHEEGD